MSSVEEYRQRLANLQGSWDTLSMLSHLSGDGTDMGSTRQAFEALATDLVNSLAAETHHKALGKLRSKSQIAIDVLVRNLYERTADIGFLSTDEDIRSFCSSGAANESDERDIAAIQQRFREYVAKYSVYDDVVLLAGDGRVLARLNDSLPVERCTDALLETTLMSRAAYVETFAPSTLFPSLGNKLIYSYRVNQAGRTVGVLCLSFKFADEVTGIFSKLREADSWHVLAFLDAQGHVLASSDPWQVPAGATLSVAIEKGGAIVRFAGREYLAVTCPTQGYQGYMGPGWYGHAMIPLEHAFDRAAAQSALSPELLARLRQSPTIFSEELRRIPVMADQIQRDLNRAVWNGNVRLAQRSNTNSNFSKVLLREIGNAGRRTQDTFEHSMSDLQQTVISAILDDAQQLASLAVDILDRNLYERANDCRWWALSASLISHLATGTPTRDDAGAMLRHINSLYTVYHDIVLFDANKRICAVANSAHAKLIGQGINEPWAGATLALRNSQDFAVSAFAPSSLYNNEHTLVFGATLRQRGGRTVGGIGIVFDTKPQLEAMLRDALPRDAQGIIAAGCIGMFVDKDGRIVASTHTHSVGTKASLPAELIGSATARLIELDGQYYAAGTSRTSGYREYAGLGVSALVLMPLGPVQSTVAARRHASHQNLMRPTHQGEQMLDIATFRCGDQWLGLLRDQVIECVDGASLRAIPGAPAWHAGLLMYQGMPLPIVDLARFVDRQPTSRGRDVIIARTSEDAPAVGLLVDDLDDIPEIATNRLLPVADLAQRRGPNVVDRAVRPNRPEDPVLFLVNLERVLMHARAVTNVTTANA